MDQRGKISKEPILLVRSRYNHMIFLLLLVCTSIVACAKTIQRETDKNDNDHRDASAEIDADTVEKESQGTEQWCGSFYTYDPVGEESVSFQVGCRHPVDRYIADKPSCAEIAFRCNLGEGAFIDDCGCGCDLFRDDYFVDEKGDYAEEVIHIKDVERQVDLPTECNGPSGYFAAFTEYDDIPLMVMQEDAVLIWASLGGIRGTAWRVEKTTGNLTVLPTLYIDFFLEARHNPTITAGGLVVYRLSRPCGGGDGYIYDTRDGSLFRRPENAPAKKESDEFVFDYTHTGGMSVFLVFDSDFYASNESGELWHAKVWPEPTEPVLVEKRGAWDDDDYSSIMGIDNDAVYWTAGANPEQRASGSGLELALYRTCRPK